MGLKKSEESPVVPLENSKSRPPRRKRLIVNPQFQAIFALYAIVTTLLMVPIFIVENVYFFSLFSSKAHVLGLPPDHELMHFVERQQSLMVVFFIGATILAIAMNVVFGVRAKNESLTC